MAQGVDVAGELEEVRRELEFMLDCRLSTGFTPEERERYGRLLAREQLLMLELGLPGHPARRGHRE